VQALIGHGGDDVAALDLDLGAHLFQRLEMQIDRAGADGAAAGQRHLGFAAAGQQRAQHQHRGAHLAHQIIGGRGVGDGLGVELEHAARMPPVGGLAVQDHLDTVLSQQVGHGGDVGQMRQIGEIERLVGQQAGRHQRQRRVLGATDGDGALERRTADDSDLIHGYSDLKNYRRGRVTPVWD